MELIHKRIVIIYVIALSAITLVMIRIASITSGEGLRQAAAVQSSYALNVGESRGMIYDRNLKPLVNRDSRYVAAVTPTPEATAALSSKLPQEEFQRLLPMLESGRPVLLPTSREVYGSGIESFCLPIRYQEDSLAHHVIGYLNGSGEGVAGIEYGYNRLLQQSGGRIRISYNINALGAALGDNAVKVTDTRNGSRSGLVLTLDREIQRIAQDAAKEMRRGAVVVMDVETGELMAMVSLPDYDPLNVAAALDRYDSPLFNRATAAYNVGSTFKLVVAAAALEQGYTTDYTYVCPGYYQLDEQRYYCHQRSGHWELAMERAIGQSCNPYFINLGQRLGAVRLLEMARAMGFGEGMQLADGVTAAAGTLPDDPNRVTLGELSNLSFGQGTLTATPVQVTQMTAIIAGGGGYLRPTLYRGITTDGITIDAEEAEEKHQVISAGTAATLREMMIFAVENGSGKNAKPAYCSAGGKTGSAQTGMYEGDTEIVHGWFTGFYPEQNPRYAITVLEEAGGNGGEAPANVFRNICNGLALQSDYYLKRRVF